LCPHSMRVSSGGAHERHLLRNYTFSKRFLASLLESN